MNKRLINLFLILSLSISLFAGTSVAGDTTHLDREKIKNLYFEGEFTEAQERLERFIEHIEDTEKNDTIFAYKYLSVIYAANPETEELAKSYMYKMISLSPAIEIVDLHPSDKIQNIFNSVKDRYIREQQYKNNYDEMGNPKASGSTMQTGEAPPSPEPEKKKSNKKLYIWVGGGVAMAATVIVFILMSGGETKDKTVANIDLSP